MNCPSPRRHGALAALAALLFAPPVFAGPGNGIRLGGADARLHPYLELESRWDSNAQYIDDKAEASLLLHVRPGLTLTAPGDRLALEGDARLDWAQYLSGQNTDKLSKLFADASLGVGVNRKGELGLELSDTFQRSTTTASLTFGSAVIANRNTLDLRVPWRPGGGALAVTPFGTWRLESFEPYSDCLDLVNAACTEAELKDLGYDDLRGGLEAKWRFLPRTAFALDGSYAARLPNSETRSAKVTGWRAMAGVQGLFTAHLGGTLKAGWGGATAAEVTDPALGITYPSHSLSSWLASAELEWLPSITTSARLGWSRDWGTDPGHPFALYATHRLWAFGNMLLAGRLTATLRGQVELLDFESADGTNRIYRLEPALDYAVARWGNVGVGYTFSKRDTNLTNPPTPEGYAYDFAKHEVWLRIRATY